MPRIRDEISELVDEYEHTPGSLDDWAFRAAAVLVILNEDYILQKYSHP